MIYRGVGGVGGLQYAPEKKKDKRTYPVLMDSVSNKNKEFLQIKWLCVQASRSECASYATVDFPQGASDVMTDLLSSRKLFIVPFSIELYINNHL